jgi:hypothetical protein
LSYENRPTDLWGAIGFIAFMMAGATFIYIAKHLLSFEVALVTVAALLCAAWFIRWAYDRKGKQAPLGITPVALAQVKSGMHVDTLGRVRAQDAFKAPISERPSAWWRVRVMTQGETPEVLATLTATERFEITDGGDLVLVVHTDTALFSVHKTELRSMAILPNERIVEFVRARNLPIDVATLDVTVVEDHVEVGETVFVRGVAQVVPAASTAIDAYRGGQQGQELLELVAAPKHPVAIGLSPIPRDEAELELVT